MALSRAKATSRGGHVLFEDSIRRELETRLTLEAELALAAERNEFELFYQPQLHLADGRLVGAEALIRWRHPVRGLVSPGEFMPVVNTSPISERIAEWVLETACAKAAAWERAGQKLRIGVNLSPSQLQSGDLAISVAQVLARTGLSPTSLELEVTEDILLHDEQSALNTFLKIQELGVRLVFDDFGTGFASLSYLKKFPLDGLKIDRSFVLGLAGQSRRRGDRQFDHRALASNWACPSSPKALRTGPPRISWSAWAAKRDRAISSDGRCRQASSKPNSSPPPPPPRWRNGASRLIRLNDPLTRPLKSELRDNGIFHLCPIALPRERDGQAPPHGAAGHINRERGFGEVADIADTSTVRRASSKDANAHAPGSGGALTPLAGISAAQWRALSTRAAEPNGYYLPEWELAVNASARGRGGADALGAWRDASTLIGLMPVISMWRAYKIPLPALVSADPYGTLCTPLLDRDMAEEAVTGILQQARQAGAHALIFRATSLDGAAMKAFTDVLHRDGMQPAGAAIACPRLP